MPIISRASIEDIRQRVNIYDLVSPVVGLRKVGANYRGLSPFTNEKTPSFYVLPDKNIFKDFSSGEAGDIYKFIQLTERLNFQEAVEAIASRFNITLEYENGQAPSGFKPSLRKEILDIHDIATEYYHENFMADTEPGKFIRDYWLNERKFDLEIARDYKIGLALPQDPKFFLGLQKKNFSYEALNKCGLFFPSRHPESEEPLFPRFRGRLMIPIREHANQRVVAFTARKLSITPDDDRSKEAKYVNSPETPLFNKSSILFGLHKAKKEVNEDLPFILVEGQLDAIRCWTIGLPAVAPQGTSITEGQLLLLKRFNDKVICLLDGDDAGKKAALRALPMAWKAGLDIKFFPLEEGTDPDDVIAAKGTSFVEELLKYARPALPYVVKALLPNPVTAEPIEKNRTANAVYELLSNLPSEGMMSALSEDLEVLLGIKKEIISRDLKDYIVTKQRHSYVRNPTDEPDKPEISDNPKSKLTNAEEDLILALFEFPALGAKLLQVVDIEWIDDSQASGRILNRILAEAEQGSWTGINQIEEIIETEAERNYYYSLRSKNLNIEEFLNKAEESVAKLFKRFIQKQIQSVDIQLANAQSLSKEKQTELARQRSVLRRSISNPPAIHLPSEF
jgi:DNA primase